MPLVGQPGTSAGSATASGDCGVYIGVAGAANGQSAATASRGATVSRSGLAQGVGTVSGIGDGPFDTSFLLPRNRAPFEIATGRAMMDRLPVPIRVIVDPQHTPEEFLPFLASHESVDLWFEDWPLQRKREMVSEAPILATLKGTRQGAIRFLSYVDATLPDAISYPSPFIMGRAVIGRTPIGHPAFVARYLVKVETVTPPNAFVMGRAVLGRARLKTPSREKFKRVLIALRVAKAPETEARVDFAHHRPLQLSDAPALDGTFYLGQYVARNKL